MTCNRSKFLAQLAWKKDVNKSIAEFSSVFAQSAVLEHFADWVSSESWDWWSYLISGHVCSSVLDADPRLAVVEVPPVELEELDEEDGQVGLMGLGVRSGVELKEAHSHKDKRIRRQTTRENLEEKKQTKQWMDISKELKEVS